MVSAEPMIRVVADLLHGFERDGYRKAILLSGHYPNQREYMLPAVTLYRDEGGTMDVLSLIENQAPGVAGDHAAKYETSFMLYLCPDLVDFERLRAGQQDDIAGPDQVVNWMGEAYEGHPCYGLVGIDPGRTPRPRWGRSIPSGCWRIWPRGWMRENEWHTDDTDRHDQRICEICVYLRPVVLMSVGDAMLHRSTPVFDRC